MQQHMYTMNFHALWVFWDIALPKVPYLGKVFDINSNVTMYQNCVAVGVLHVWQ